MILCNIQKYAKLNMGYNYTDKQRNYVNTIEDIAIYGWKGGWGW